MFSNSNIHYTNPLGGTSFSSSHSANSSFSDGTSESWDSSTVYTPMSTPRRGSPNDIKYENSVFSAPTPISSPERYGAVNGFCAMNTLTQSMMSIYQDPQQVFPGLPRATPQAIPNFNSYGPYLDNSMVQSFNSNDGLPLSAPALVHDNLHSPVSEMSSSPPMLENCVAPSQTTFDEFGLQSPMHPVKSLQFDVNYDCQSSDYNPGFLVDPISPANTRYLAHEYSQYKSEHSTPSRGPSNRQLFAHLHAQENEALTGFQPKSEDDHFLVKRTRMVRKRSKGATCVYDSIPTSIGVNPKATFTCAWPGCVKRFARSEHRKRHHLTHEGMKEPCEFCPREFPTNRKDNYKTHLRLHADPQKGSRTKYHPGAAAALQRMEEETRKCVAPKPSRREGKITHRVARTRS